VGTFRWLAGNIVLANHGELMALQCVGREIIVFEA
jgi:hypothetical protein